LIAATNSSKPYRELVFYIAYDEAYQPVDVGQKLIAALGVGRAQMGCDVLTGGVEVRVYYDESVLEHARKWLLQGNIVCDIGLL
jgi:hypothetical protein